ARLGPVLSSSRPGTCAGRSRRAGARAEPRAPTGDTTCDDALPVDDGRGVASSGRGACPIRPVRPPRFRLPGPGAPPTFHVTEPPPPDGAHARSPPLLRPLP